MPLPADYRERVYAGVLGKIVGVYLGRPFENWTHARIAAELGPITGYVNERFGEPLVVTDDDIAGTFTFIRALEEHGARADLSAAEIGRTWLNAIVENRTILWWGGNGTSTEHTAWLNLKRGIAAPASGSIAVNGATLAEQIGAQIFIDGWAMVAPGQPALAARLAGEAARVSHDGEAVHAAMLLAAMEAEAFLSDDIGHLIDTGLSVIPPASTIARLIADLRGWHARYPDWRDTRARIEQRYGYASFPGICHVVPNHALVIMTLLYAPDDFHAAMAIVNGAGWDTDCNAGNVGCLLGLKRGLRCFEGGPDWRGPVADRILISSSDGGGAITDAVRVSARIADLGHRLAGLTPPPAPRGGAQFHFALPGSVQGFAADREAGSPGALVVGNEAGALALRVRLAPGQRVAAMTPTFSPPEAPRMRSYDLMACPLVYPGQRIEAALSADEGNTAPLSVALSLKAYGRDDILVPVDAPAAMIAPGGRAGLAWTLPDTGGQPIQQIGVVVRAPAEGASGVLRLHHLRWDGEPLLHLRRPEDPGDFWRRAWVNGVTTFSGTLPQAFRIAQNVGEGIVIHGTRDWHDYSVACTLTVHLAREAGLAVRVQGLRRYYALVLAEPGMIRLVKLRDEARTVLAEQPLRWSLERPYAMRVTVRGQRITCMLDDHPLFDMRDDEAPFETGALGLMINAGALSTPELRVVPA